MRPKAGSRRPKFHHVTLRDSAPPSKRGWEPTFRTVSSVVPAAYLFCVPVCQYVAIDIDFVFLVLLLVALLPLSSLHELAHMTMKDTAFDTLCVPGGELLRIVHSRCGRRAVRLGHSNVRYVAPALAMWGPKTWNGTELSTVYTCRVTQWLSGIARLQTDFGPGDFHAALIA